MPTVRIPLIGSMTSRDGDNTAAFANQKDQVFINCDFQIVQNGVTGKVSTWIRGRNDFKASGRPTGASGQGTCVHLWRGLAVGLGVGGIMSAFGSTNSTIYEGSSSIGSITGQCHFMAETKVNDVATMLFASNYFAGGSNRAWYYPEGGALTEITDTDFPPKQGTPLYMVGNFVSMDGYNFIMTSDGKVWHSDLNSISGWSALSYLTAQDYPGIGKGLARQGRTIVAFKSGNVEFFKNAGNAAGSVLAREGSSISVGCTSQYSIVQYGDRIYWVGTEEGKVGVYQLAGLSHKKISTAEVDSLFAEAAATEASLMVITSYGKPYLYLQTSRGAGSGYAFDPETGIWQLWTFSVAPYASDSFSILGADATVWSTFYVSLGQTEVYVNDQAPVSGSVQTGPIDFGTANRKSMHKLRVIGDKTTASMPLTISWSDDDYQSFSTGRTVDMNAANPQLMRGGTFRRRAFKIEGIGEAAADRIARLEAIDVTFYESTL